MGTREKTENRDEKVKVGTGHEPNEGENEKRQGGLETWKLTENRNRQETRRSET